jgi:Domain of unknown function (DUF4388)
MNELNGTLEGVGLPAVVRFLSGLKKTGCLHVSDGDWRGEIFFEAGQVTSASLGTRQGLWALGALVQALPDGSFAFESDAVRTGDATISLSSDALLAYLDEVPSQTANGAPVLPSLDAIPVLIEQDDSRTTEQPLPLDRATLQTLLAVDGQRSVREIVAQRGSFDALWQVGSLAEVGLIRLEPPTQPAPRREPAVEEAAKLEPAAATPTLLDVVDATGHCPKLGFEDDPGSSFGRPTRLHRCFAAGTPMPLSLDQQRELCLSDQFGTCPRLSMAGVQHTRTNGALPPVVGPQARSHASAPTPESDDPRIVRLPFVARANNAERAAAADLHAVGAAEPARFRSGSPPAVRGEGSSRLTRLRSRIERSTGAASAGAVVQPPVTPASRPRPDSKSFRQALVGDPVERRLGGIPVGVIASLGVVLIMIAVVTFLLAPHMGDLLSEESLDTSALPNTSAVVAGTPIAQLTSARATAAPRAGTPGASNPASASPTSAPSAPASPTLPPEPNPAPGSTAAEQSSAGLLFEETFANTTRSWPSSAQGTALLANGTYRIIPRQAGQFVAIGAPILDVPQDVVVNATFHKLGGPPGGGYGIIVRDQAPVPQNGTSQDGRYYVLEAGDKGEVGIWRRDGDHWVDLLPWQKSNAVRSGTASNELSVRAIGNRLTLFVNGSQVASRDDATLANGGVGVFVGGDGNQVVLDRFSVQLPE